MLYELKPHGHGPGEVAVRENPLPGAVRERESEFPVLDERGQLIREVLGTLVKEPRAPVLHLVAVGGDLGRERGLRARSHGALVPLDGGLTFVEHVPHEGTQVDVDIQVWTDHVVLPKVGPGVILELALRYANFEPGGWGSVDHERGVRVVSEDLEEGLRDLEPVHRVGPAALPENADPLRG